MGLHEGYVSVKEQYPTVEEYLDAVRNVLVGPLADAATVEDVEHYYGVNYDPTLTAEKLSTIAKPTREYLFTVKGGFNVEADLKVMRAANGDVIGFVTADGKGVCLTVCLEVVDNSKQEPNRITYVSDDLGLNLLGMRDLDYSRADFEPTGGENEDVGEGEEVEA